MWALLGGSMNSYDYGFMWALPTTHLASNQDCLEVFMSSGSALGLRVEGCFLLMEVSKRSLPS